MIAITLRLNFGVFMRKRTIGKSMIGSCTNSRKK